MSQSSVISIVDDDPSVRRALARLVRSWGFCPETYGSAKEFLDATHPEGVVCVILDVHLGRMSGFDLGRQLTALDAPPPIIFITAHDDATTREHIRMSGAEEYLRKPFEAQALLAAIGRALGRDLGPN